MIQANELRIGNYVYDIDKDILQIGEILDICVKFKNTSLASRYTKIQPIPLTEEILLKCGFENYTGDFLELTITDEFSIIWVGYLGIMIGGSTVFFPDKDKVHELQNLYKELKGEELTVNL